MSDADILKEAQERYQEAEDGCAEIKNQYSDDYTFGRLGEQWPLDIQQQRKLEARPCLTINRMPSFLRQVINDGRQNRPAIKVRPIGSGADVETAKVFAGIIRHIEAISDADVAYDTALDCAASGGFGFVGVDVDYTDDDTFDQDLKIVSFPNPLAVTWDARTTSYDSSDWEHAFIPEDVDKDKFRKEYPKANPDPGNFASDDLTRDWYTKDTVRVAKYYLRDEIQRPVALLSNGMVVDTKEIDDEFKALMEAGGITVMRERTVKSYRVTIRKITGQDILETTQWAGTCIPIIPCWGDVLNHRGKRYSYSLIHDAKDAQRIHNFSRSAATEMVSLAPKVPFIGEEGSFDADLDKWTNINSKSWPYVEFKKGAQMPQRQPFTGVPEGAMAEAQASLEDMKTIIGIHDASLGIPGNEISGKAIRYRQHEGDVATYHFIDNQHRMIRGVGRVLLEMIPLVYTPGRIVRIIGEDGRPSQVTLGGQQPNPAPQTPQMGANA